MTLFYDPFKKEIAQLILEEIQILSQEWALSISTTEDHILDLLSIPPDFQLGQAACPCFPFAKLFKQAPNKIAEILSEKINAKKKHYILNAKSINGYLNFYLHFENLFSHLLKQLENNSSFQQKFLEPQQIDKIVVEYSQPNTHKALHVGHLRCLVLGDAVCNLLDYAGHTTIRATYPGDIGTHVAKVIWYLTHPQNKELPTENKAHWLGQMYAQADETLKSFKGSEKEEHIKKEIAEILRQISLKSGNYYELWHKTRQWSLDYLKEIYAWLNAHFDIWYYESESDEPSKELVKNKFAQGFFVEDKGAIGIDLSQWKLGFAMYLKSDGNGLYLTKDLDLLSKKFSDPSVTKSIYVVDARQKFHFEQLFKTAQLMGYPQATKSVHLSYETVNTEQGTPFSSRELNGLGLLDLKQKMEEKVTHDYLERYRGQWSAEEIQQTARKVTIGALKYGMLRVDNNTQIHFSLSEWLRLDGDTGPYLQYVHARCASILNKLGSYPKNFTPEFVEKEEKQLFFLLSRFNDFALQAATHCKPSLLANYLYDVSKNFNRFYETCSIKESQGSSQATRLALVFLTQKAIYHGLQLLGIPAPEKM